MLDPIITKSTGEVSEDDELSSHFASAAFDPRDELASSAAPALPTHSRSSGPRVVGSCITRQLFELFKSRNSTVSVPENSSNLLCLVMFATDGDNSSEGLLMATLLSALLTPVSDLGAAAPQEAQPHLIFGNRITPPFSWSLAFGPPASSDLYV